MMYLLIDENMYGAGVIIIFVSIRHKMNISLIGHLARETKA